MISVAADRILEKVNKCKRKKSYQATQQSTKSHEENQAGIGYIYSGEIQLRVRGSYYPTTIMKAKVHSAHKQAHIDL